MCMSVCTYACVCRYLQKQVEEEGIRLPETKITIYLGVPFVNPGNKIRVLCKNTFLNF